MTRRFQFNLKALLWLMLAAAFFFAGVRFERERRRLEDEAAQRAARKAMPFPRRATRGNTVDPRDNFFDSPIQLPPPADSPFSRTPRGEPAPDE